MIDTPNVVIVLNAREQALLLANEMNDHESWSDIAQKIRDAREAACSVITS
jgi:hypothetical protein